jgi:hypothetical protein
MSEEKVESKTEDAPIHDEGLSKSDEAALGIAEEHSLSLWHVVRHNKRIVWWCFFFSMSAIGWYVKSPWFRDLLALTLIVV